MKFIPLSVPNLKGREKEYVMDALDKEWVSTGGSYINQLEENIARYLKVESAVACQSGTAALHLSLMVSNVNSGDEVIVPTLTFIAAVNPVKYIGAYPVFMDCDDSLTLDANKLEKFLEEECEYKNNELINKFSKRRIKAIVVVHVFGNGANIEKIVELAHSYGLTVIEDATEALGSYFTEGKYKGKYLGTIGDFGAFSFNGNKIITTGGGGMVVAKDQEKLQRIKYLSTQAKDDPLYYRHEAIGYNYRMTNLQAALGVAQLEQLEGFIDVKQRNYSLYSELLKDVKGVRLLDFSERIRPNYWFYSLMIEDEKVSVEEIIEKLYQKGIQTRPIWGLIHEQTPYKLDQSYEIEKASYYYKHIINIPCSSNLSSEEVKYVVESVKDIIHE